MNQKLETKREPRDTADEQLVNRPHFDLHRDSTDSSVAGPAFASTLSDQSQSASSTRLLQNGQERAAAPERNSSNVLVTVLMPCLNEARTLAACIQQAHAGCQAALAPRSNSPSWLREGREERAGRALDEYQRANCTRPTYEILIADNGSTDGSPDIATTNGARVVRVDQKGYGAALRGGIAAARGKYIVMGDSDCSYDFGEVPRFLDKLEEGYDLVMGNRFAGGIMPGAMPWHHRYIGNPVLSGLGRLLYRTPCRDWHCGLRAFDREKVVELGLKSQGMEFASELVIQCTKANLKLSELNIDLYPDKRKRAPHLRSFRDGFRHLYLMLCLRFWSQK